MRPNSTRWRPCGATSRAGAASWLTLPATRWRRSSRPPGRGSSGFAAHPICRTRFFVTVDSTCGSNRHPRSQRSLDGRLWEEAVFVGAAAWFPAQVLTAPRAGHVELVVPSWVRDHPHVTGLFGDLADRPLIVSFRERYGGTVRTHDFGPEDQLVPAGTLLL